MKIFGLEIQPEAQKYNKTEGVIVDLEENLLRFTVQCDKDNSKQRFPA